MKKTLFALLTIIIGTCIVQEKLCSQPLIPEKMDQEIIPEKLEEEMPIEAQEKKFEQIEHDIAYEKQSY